MTQTIEESKKLWQNLTLQKQELLVQSKLMWKGAREQGDVYEKALLELSSKLSAVESSWLRDAYAKQEAEAPLPCVISSKVVGDYRLLITEDPRNSRRTSKIISRKSDGTVQVDFCREGQEKFECLTTMTEVAEFIRAQSEH